MAPEDILYLFLPWSRSASLHGAHNALIGDVAFEMYPWFVLARDSLLHGHWPVWNPYAFGGSPLMANGQSAVLSPFTLAVLPFPPAYGFSVMLLLKFWVAGVGTALFARRLGLGWLPAALGGLAFATSAFMVSWLGFPHTAVAALVPWGFLASQGHTRNRGRVAPWRGWRRSSGCNSWPGTQRHRSTSAGGRWPSTLSFAPWRPAPGAGGGSVGWPWRRGVGLLLAAVQLVPFIDLLRRDPFYADRVGGGGGLTHLPPRALLTWLVPNRIGNPGIDGLIGQAPNATMRQSASSAFGHLPLAFPASSGCVGRGRRLPGHSGHSASWRPWWFTGR